MKRLARENSGSKADSMDFCHVILKTHHVIKKQPLGLAHRDPLTFSLKPLVGPGCFICDGLC